MILQITGKNVPHAWQEAWWVAKHHWQEGESRNGRVLSVPYPTLLTIKAPTERVLFDPIRDANPFFHVMEFVWMMAGSNDAKWISQFNKRMMSYADDGILRGAYGWRWRNPSDQIANTITLLRKDATTRQVVLSMWDPLYDGPRASTSDRPCNTHIYFRVIKGQLDMTVCNRSNDMIWGMLGANAVHMTLLHEMVAAACQMSIGEYRVFTNNLHVYPDIPRFRDMSEPGSVYDYYDTVSYFPLLGDRESYLDLRADCEQLLRDPLDWHFNTVWMEAVAWPMYNAYLFKQERDQWIKRIFAEDWRLACEQWVARRATSAETSQQNGGEALSTGTAK